MARLPLLRLFSLAIRQLLRDARAGELRVLFFALVVAVAASTAIGYFGARLERRHDAARHRVPWRRPAA